MSVLVIAAMTIAALAMAPSTQVAASEDSPTGLLPLVEDEIDHPEPVTWGKVKTVFKICIGWHVVFFF